MLLIAAYLVMNAMIKALSSELSLLQWELECLLCMDPRLPLEQQKTGVYFYSMCGYGLVLFIGVFDVLAGHIA